MTGATELPEAAQCDTPGIVLLSDGLGRTAPDVAVLFARRDSGYKAMPQLDVYDIDRDARSYDGPFPVVAHPPCRGWGRLRHFAKPRPDERNLARLAVALVREFGGVLEHPSHSTLWAAQRLPQPGQRDAYGGWTMGVQQWQFGHRAETRTWLYLVGCEPKDTPDLPALKLGQASHVIAQDSRPRRGTNGERLRKDMPGWRPEVLKAEREHTPAEFRVWLVDLARRCKAVEMRSMAC